MILVVSSWVTGSFELCKIFCRALISWHAKVKLSGLKSLLDVSKIFMMYGGVIPCMVCVGCSIVDWEVRHFLIKLQGYLFCWKILYKWSVFVFWFFRVAALCLCSSEKCSHNSSCEMLVINLVVKRLDSVDVFFIDF